MTERQHAKCGRTQFSAKINNPGEWRPAGQQAGQNCKLMARITPQQMRAARELLGWSRERLAAWGETTLSFILTYETEGRVMVTPSRDKDYDAMVAIRTALESAGIDFIGGNRVRLRKVEN
jgi:ribosome-binding protein aMBF1 (putative translation factor)